MPFHFGKQCLNFTGTLAASALLLGFSGCSMCCAPFDYDYGYTGGAWVRDNPSDGRVGSVFAPAGYKAVEDRPEPEDSLVPPPDGERETPRSPRNDSEDLMPPPPETTDPGMISTPRLRAVRDYLPEN